MLTYVQWAMLEPLIEACRPRGKILPRDLRRTISAILWRHQNGAKWRSVPASLAPGRERLRPSSAGHAWVWESLLGLAQERGVNLGTSIRVHQKAAGARRKGALKLSEMHVRRLVDLVGAMIPRPA